MSLAHLYSRTATVSRLARTADSQGGWTESTTEVATIACRLRPVSAQERIRGRLATGPIDYAEITHVLYCAPGTDIRRSDTVAIDGTSYEVIDVRTPSVIDHHLEVDLTSRQAGG